MSNLLKNLLLALTLALLAGATYYLLSGSEEDEDLVVPVTSNAAQRTAKILADTERIQNLNFDNTIFIDKRFKDLTDFSVLIPDVPAGRENPFEPVE